MDFNEQRSWVSFCSFKEDINIKYQMKFWLTGGIVWIFLDFRSLIHEQYLHTPLGFGSVKPKIWPMIDPLVLSTDMYISSSIIQVSGSIIW